MHPSTNDLIRALREDGLRITAARRAICTVLAESHEDHLTAVDIWNSASAIAGVTIDQSTVYRTIDVFQGLGWLHHVHLGHGPGIVHFTEESDHHHLVCESCGKSVDIPVDELDTVLGTLAERHGFARTSVHFALIGTCDACSN